MISCRIIRNAMTMIMRERLFNYYFAIGKAAEGEEAASRSTPTPISLLRSNALSPTFLRLASLVAGGEGEIGEVEFERGSSENREWREYAGREVGVEVVEEEDVEEVPDGRELVRISIDEVGEGKGKTKKTSGFTVEGVWENWRMGLERTLRGRGELKNTNGSDAMDVDLNPTDTSATPDGTPATPLPPQPIDLAGVQVSRALNLDPITPTPTVQKLLALGFPFLLQTLSQLTLDSKITLIYSSDDVLQTRYKVNKERSR